MLFNEPKLLKCSFTPTRRKSQRVSVLFNEPKLLKSQPATPSAGAKAPVSVLFNEPKLLKWGARERGRARDSVSVLFNEPKLLKSPGCCRLTTARSGFSALQRAEIAEIPTSAPCPTRVPDPDTCTSSLLSLPGVSSQHSYFSMDGRVSQLDFCARTASSCETRRFPFQSAKRCKNG